VLIPRTTGLRRQGIQVHHSLTLTSADVTQIDGIPCTSVPRTLLDLAAASPSHVLTRACNQAEINKALDFGAITDLLARSHRHPGAARLRAALRVDRLGEDRTKTPLERRFLGLCARAEVTRPAINQWMPVGGEEMECDFVWNAERVVVEVDGWETHRTRAAFENDRRRDRLLQTGGWRVIRLTWRDVTERADQVTEMLRALLQTPAPPPSHVTK
jgi:very-short-patch-repair endonuclease